MNNVKERRRYIRTEVPVPVIIGTKQENMIEELHEPEAKPEVDLRTICAWCQKVMKEGPENSAVTHGICEDCSKEQIEKLQKQKS